MRGWVVNNAGSGLLVITVLSVVLLSCGSQVSGELPPPIAELDEQASGQPMADSPTQPPQPSVETAAGAAGELIVAFNLGMEGKLQPCDCPEGASGGLARQATLAQRMAASVRDFVWVAGPGSLRVEADAERQRVEQLGSLRAAAGVGVFALGSQDLTGWSPAELDAVASALPVPCLATNLDGSADGPLKRVLLVGDEAHPVALLSLLEQNSAGLARRGYPVRDPVYAVEKALASLSRKPTAVIAFCDVQSQRLEALAAELPDVDFFVGASGQGGTDSSSPGGGVLSVSRRGR